MEKIINNSTMIILSIIVIFLLIVFIRLLGRRKGLQPEDLEKNRMSIVDNLKESFAKDSGYNPIKKKTEIIIEYPVGSLNHKIAQIPVYDKEFEYKKFISHATNLYKTIVEDFSEGRIDEIKDLVTPSIYEKWQHYHANNQSNLQPVEVLDIMIADVVDVEFEKKSSLDTTFKETNPNSNADKASEGTVGNKVIPKLTVSYYARQKRNNNIVEAKDRWVFLLNENNNWVITSMTKE